MTQGNSIFIGTIIVIRIMDEKSTHNVGTYHSIYINMFKYVQLNIIAFIIYRKYKHSSTKKQGEGKEAWASQFNG